MTPAERKKELRKRFLPGTNRTWLTVARDAARATGASIDDVIAMVKFGAPSLARAVAWGVLLDGAFSSGEIGHGWGVHHTSVGRAVRKLGQSYSIDGRA